MIAELIKSDKPNNISKECNQIIINYSFRKRLSVFLAVA